MNTQTQTQTETHTCACTVCNGITFTAPAGYIAGTPKTIRDMVHNYAQMLLMPIFATQLGQRGVKRI